MRIIDIRKEKGDKERKIERKEKQEQKGKGKKKEKRI